MFQIVVLTTLAFLSAQEAEGVQAQQVHQLVKQLDSPQLTERDQAERQLEELGVNVLSLLPPIDDRTSAEATKRLTRLRQVLMRAQGQAAAEPSQVTLHGKSLLVSHILSEISKQTGNAIADHRVAFGQQAEDKTIDVDFDKTPFWQALDKVLDDAGLTIYGFAGQPGLFVVNRPPGAATRSAKASYVSIFRVEPVRFEAVRDLRDGGRGGLRLFVELSWEPRLQPFSILQPLAEVEAVGSAGEPIPVASRQASLETLVRRGFSTVEFDIPLDLPSRKNENIQLLKGKFTALVPGPLEAFRFDELPVAKRGTRPKAIKQRMANTELTLESVRENNEIWQAGLRIRFDAPGAALESHRGWMLENEAYFLDAEGNRHEAGGVEQTLHAQGELGMNYLFDLPDGPDGMTFVYRTPLMVLELPVEYEFRDLPLP